MHLCGDATGERDLVGGQQRDELAADLRHLVAREVVDDHQAMQAEHLAVDLVHGLACFVEDVVVLAEAKDLLANLVSHCSAPGAPSPSAWDPKSIRAAGWRRGTSTPVGIPA